MYRQNKSIFHGENGEPRNYNWLGGTNDILDSEIRYKVLGKLVLSFHSPLTLLVSGIHRGMVILV